MKKQKLVRNAAQCVKCNTVIESRYTHDFVWCECKTIFTDGGINYIHRGGDPEAIIDLCEWIEMDE